MKHNISAHIRSLINTFQNGCSSNLYTSDSNNKYAGKSFKEKARTFGNPWNILNCYITLHVRCCCYNYSLWVYTALHITHDRKRKFLEQSCKYNCHERRISTTAARASLELKREKSETKKGKLCKSRKSIPERTFSSWRDWNKKSSQQIILELETHSFDQSGSFDRIA